MKTPVSILPQRPGGPTVGPAAPEPEATHDDESLLEGATRRYHDVLADMRAGDTLLLLLLAIPWAVGLLLLIEPQPWNWSINVNDHEWRWLTDWFPGPRLGWGAIAVVKGLSLLLAPALLVLAGFMVYRWGRGDLEQSLLAVLVILLAFGLIYSYVPGFKISRDMWSEPQYSYGWMVPICSLLMLLWWRRPLQPVAPSAIYAGLGLIAASLLFRLACARYRIITLDMYTFVPVLAGAFLLAGGWKAVRWGWAPIAVLIFMYPLPEDANRYLLGPLQISATKASTFALQTLGFDAFREGNKIFIGEHVLGVVDVCSGLRMLTVFIWLAFMLMLVLRGPWWENLAIVILSGPIAVLVNVIRITVTGMLYTVNAELAEKVFHDWAGMLMMPLALLLLFAVHSFCARLVIEEDVAPTAVVRGRPPGFGPPPVSLGRKPPETRFRPQDGPAGGI